MPMQEQSERTWGEPVAGLRLGIGFRGGLAEFCLQNVGAARIDVLSHVQVADARHFDWFSLLHTAADGATRTLLFTTDRDRAAPVSECLEPGMTLVHPIELDAWARLPANGGAPLGPDGKAVLVYEVNEADPVWRGRLEVTARVPA